MSRFTSILRSSLRCGSAMACALALIAVTASGQTRDGRGLISGGGAEAHECSDCHLGDHGMSMSGRLARSSITRAVAQRAGLLTPDPATEICLGCHSTAADRSMIGAASTGDKLLPIQTGRYLGPTLTDDHPVGPVDEIPQTGRSIWLDPSLQSFRNRSLGTDPADDQTTIRCTSCHVVHQGSEAWLGATGPGGSCGDCHDPVTYGGGAHGVMTCLGCHQMHGAPGEHLTAGIGSDGLCVGCHEVVPGTTRSDVGPRGRPAHTDRPQPGRCTDCHRVHVSAEAGRGGLHP